jgi:predicted urease superfamily metal-dependent hydrolase
MDTMVVISGTYSTHGNEFIIETDQVNDSIDPKAATYIWSYQNDILVLRLKGENSPPEYFRHFSEEASERKLDLPNILDI